MSGGIVVVGSVNADLLVRVARLPGPGETLLATSSEVRPGGKGANQAVAAALLGAPVTMIGAVGDDAHAAIATSGLERAGVDLARLARVAGPTGLAIVQVDDRGENSIVVVPGANATVGPELVARHRERIASADVVVLQGELPGETVEAAARTAGGRLVLNLAPVVAIDLAVVRPADPLVVNEHEAALGVDLLGGVELVGGVERAGAGAEAGVDVPMSVPDASTRRGDRDADDARAHGTRVDDPRDAVVTDRSDAADPERLVDALLAAGVHSVVLTVGADGAVIGTATTDGPRTVRVPAPNVTAVDTTGAGDAFTGALAVALLRGDGLHAAAAYAVRVGAFAVGGPGAQDAYPTTEDELPASH